MKITKKLLALGMSLVLMGSVLAGCGGKTQKADEANTLVYGSQDYAAINPALFEHGEINLLLFAGLTAHDETDKVVPGMAEKWEWDEATKTYTFHIRDGITWQDGKKFTAEDVKFTLDAIMKPDNASEIASNYEDITKIEIPDEKTVKISLKAPNVAMLDYLTIGILPKHLLDGKDMATDDFNRKPIGTGPYKLVSWDKGQSITMEKFDNYYAGAPKIDKVIFKIVEDTKARAMQLKSGEIDMAQVPPNDAKQFEGNGDFKIYDMKTADYRGILYNFNNPLFKNNRELPNALSTAIDRQAIIDSVLLGQGQIAYSPLQAGAYNNPSIEKYDYNPAKAQAALEAAGWVKGSDGIYEKNGTKLSFKINISEGDQVRVDIANICAQNLQAIGVDAKVSVNAETDWAGQETFLVGWGSPFDPDDHTYKIFGTDKGSNYNGYSNPKVDELLKKARETEDDSLRKQYYNEFQVELSKDLPYTFIAYVDAIYVAKTSIQGITPDTILGHHGVGIFWNIANWSINK
ncbi:MAG: ABC transporter substrate-binding protein [Eubacterium sp.]